MFSKKKKHKVFLIVESIYAKSGHLLDLKTVLQFKEKYPFRIILEESLSIGVLGKTGRGLTEYIGVPSTKVEIITASVGNALGSVGGFATGTTAITNHMRLNCSGYVFSCSSPPYVSKSCTAALGLLEHGNEIKVLQQNIKILHQGLATCKHLITTSSPVSPYVIIRLKDGSQNDVKDVVEQLFQKGIAVVQPKYSKRETTQWKFEPHFKITVSVLHTPEDIQILIKELNSIKIKNKN